MLFSCNTIGQLCLGGPGYNSRTVNRLKPRAETITEGEHEGFIAGHSTTEQIFNLRIPCERYLQHQQYLYHVFVDLKRRLIEYGTKLFDLLLRFSTLTPT